uniref:Uncharacterized protein n=1 Tax=Glossina austeni TaxID=7395 RepID=A0A1A9UUT5_GLOAU
MQPSSCSSPQSITTTAVLPHHRLEMLIVFESTFLLKSALTVSLFYLHLGLKVTKEPDDFCSTSISTFTQFSIHLSWQANNSSIFSDCFGFHYSDTFSLLFAIYAACTLLSIFRENLSQFIDFLSISFHILLQLAANFIILLNNHSSAFQFQFNTKVSMDMKSTGLDGWDKRRSSFENSIAVELFLYCERALIELRRSSYKQNLLYDLKRILTRVYYRFKRFSILLMNCNNSSLLLQGLLIRLSHITRSTKLAFIVRKAQGMFLQILCNTVLKCTVERSFRYIKVLFAIKITVIKNAQNLLLLLNMEKKSVSDVIKVYL